MKVLFAVNNESISESIIKLYQQQYREIISAKNVYYFNAIIKELQRDQTYDRVVISEDLEPYSNNNFDIIDKFLFEQLDKISDEAIDEEGADIPIIFIATDRRSKSDNLLSKLFSIGVYDALLGQDRNIPEVCKLLNKPRTKREAKAYYKIESEEVQYQAEVEDSVSETEIKNILTHYKKLGKNTDRYVDSFNNIAAQYTDAQLRIITKFLPIGVRAVLEQESPKYQSIMTFGEGTYKNPEKVKEKKNEDLKIGFIETNSTKTKPTKPVVIPSTVDTKSVKKLARKTEEPKMQPVIQEEDTSSLDDFFDDEELENTNNTQANVSGFEEKPETQIEEPVKKGRGRPRKIVDPSEQINTTPKKRGRPRKVTPEPTEEEDTILPGFEFEDEEKDEDNILPGFNTEEENTSFSNFEETTNKYQEEANILPGFENNLNLYNTQHEDDEDKYIDKVETKVDVSEFSKLLTRDKKIVAFVGTSKAGTSFLINNIADMLSRTGIKTAIVDLTENRNSYYIYTKNEESLRRVASNCLEKIENGIVEGVDVSKNLTVFTSVPNQKVEVGDIGTLVSNLIKKFSLVLLDCDYKTPDAYFELSQEIYLVQTMDILTIQPLTAFLRELQSNDKLDPSKLKIVINKEMRVRGLSVKAIVGGMSCYNNPEMSYMRELFDREKIPVITIPFDEDTLSKYLSGMVDCIVSTSGYSRQFLVELKKLSDSVYPLVTNKFRPDYSKNNKFSSNANEQKQGFSNTLSRMKDSLK